MSNKPDHRGGSLRRTEHGPRWESANPGKGCNATHVARARRKWKRRLVRRARREGEPRERMGSDAQGELDLRSEGGSTRSQGSER